MKKDQAYYDSMALPSSEHVTVPQDKNQGGLWVIVLIVIGLIAGGYVLVAPDPPKPKAAEEEVKQAMIAAEQLRQAWGEDCLIDLNGYGRRHWKRIPASTYSR